MKENKEKLKGFTLVEVIICLFIFMIVAKVIPTFFNGVFKARIWEQHRDLYVVQTNTVKINLDRFLNKTVELTVVTGNDGLPYEKKVNNSKENKDIYGNVEFIQSNDYLKIKDINSTDYLILYLSDNVLHMTTSFANEVRNVKLSEINSLYVRQVDKVLTKCNNTYKLVDIDADKQLIEVILSSKMPNFDRVLNTKFNQCYNKLVIAN